MSMTTVDLTQESPDDVADQFERPNAGFLLNPLFWTGLTIAGSAFKFFRFEVAGMAFHPYMATLFFLIFRTITRIHNFPARVGRPAGLFFLLYVISLVQGTGFVIQLAKITVMAITMVMIAVSVRSREDFVAGAFGLGACALVLCVRGLINGPGNFGSINPIEGSQKNAFSLFYLPALALCLHLLFTEQLNILRKSILALFVASIFAAILLSTNRSGWLTSGVVLFLMFTTNRQRFRMGVFIAIVAFLAFVVAEIVLAEANVVLERDAHNAVESDNLRMQLVIRAISIGLENPLFGVSPTRLLRMLGTVGNADADGLDCHNVTGYLIGGSGLLTFGAYCLFAFSMLRPPFGFRSRVTDPAAIRAVRILFIMTATWLIRSQFQEDVLFSPTFAMGLGLCIGLCTCTGVYKSSTADASVGSA